MEKKEIFVSEEIKKFTLEKFKELYKLDIADKIDTVKISEKRKLSYLSWSQGYKIMKEQDQDSSMEFIENPETKNYLFPQTTELMFQDVVDETETVVTKKEIYKVEDPKTIVRSLEDKVEVITTTTTKSRKEWIKKNVTTYYVKTKVTLFGLTLQMSLPVMDAKHNSLENPTTRDTSDSLMRCFVKNLSLFGIGLPLYNKEDLEQFGILPDSPESNDKKNKDYIMNTYRTNKNPSVVRCLQDYSAQNGMFKDLSSSQLEELANILKGLGA